MESLGAGLNIPHNPVALRAVQGRAGPVSSVSFHSAAELSPLT
jgi:hypothetical protein